MNSSISSVEEILTDGIRWVAILGHVRPDGDCIGSCLGLYHYIRKIRPEISVDVYLEPFREDFFFLKGEAQVHHEMDTEQIYDLCIVCDASDRERLGEGAVIFDRARDTVSIDHHKTNTGFAKRTDVRPEISSTCEILFELMEEKLVDRQIAACLYTGMVHDTGVFKYQSTTARTMEIAGKLMDTGIGFTDIIDQTFYRKSYEQNRIMGLALIKSQLAFGGACIHTVLTLEEMGQYSVTPKDLDGIAEQLRIVDGVEVAVFLYETEPGIYKASMRSKKQVDVSRVAARFGGGGHARAAGCSLKGSGGEAVQLLLSCLEEEFQIHD